MSAKVKASRIAQSNRWIVFLRATAPAVLILASVLSASADEIVIGASVPLSGPLAGFGSFVSWGYKHAVAEVNRAGGIKINGKNEQVKLILRDDMTNPNVTASNTETLITRDHVVAMLGSCTPALVNAGALVAERHKLPMVNRKVIVEGRASARPFKFRPKAGLFYACADRRPNCRITVAHRSPALITEGDRFGASKEF